LAQSSFVFTFGIRAVIIEMKKLTSERDRRYRHDLDSNDSLSRGGSGFARRGRGAAALYPEEYAVSAFPDQVPGTGIVDSHSLIPDALFHAFATFGALMAPHLPLDRRQHEMSLPSSLRRTAVSIESTRAQSFCVG